MKISLDLFELIKSMTKQEKRYFKLSVPANKRRISNYIRLFDVIDKQTVYDETIIRRHFAKEKFIKYLHISKSYLHSLILKSLRSYHHEISIDAQLKDMLKDIEILFEKGLLNQVEKALLKAKDIAYKYERFPMLIAILQSEKALLSMKEYDVSTSDVVKINQEENDILNKIKNLNDYWKINFKVSILNKKTGAARNEKELKAIKSLINNPLLKNEENALSNRAMFLFYFTHSNYCHFTQRDQKMKYEYCKRLVKQIESRPEFMRDSHTYFTALNHYAVAQQGLKKYSEAILIFQKIRMIKTNSPILQSKIFSTSYNNELDLYNQTGEFEKGLDMIDEIENGLKKFKNQISGNFKILLYYNITCAFFGAGKYSQALFWLNNVLNESTYNKSREDIHCFARILNLIIHYEKGNKKLIKYIIKSTYRFLYKKNRLFKVESITLNFIKDLYKIKTQGQLTSAFKKTQNELIIISNDPLEKIALEYFDFYSWLESKIEKRSFADVIKDKQKLANRVAVF